MQLFGLDNTVLNMDPETVPFRLARILTNAIEVSGIKVTYRITCENLKGVLRDNKETLIAVLEAFVYDPLINWRLLPRLISKKTCDSTPSSLGADWDGRPFFSICSKFLVKFVRREIESNERPAPVKGVLESVRLAVNVDSDMLWCFSG